MNRIALHLASFLPLRFLRGLKCRRGATAVEFGLVFPIFLVMALGIVEAGRVMWIKASMQFACEEASRYAMARESLGEDVIKAYAETSFNGIGFDPNAATFSTGLDSAGGVTFITVSATYNFVPLVPLVGMSSFTLNASSRSPRTL